MITLEAHYVYLLLGSTAIMLALACLSFARFENRCREIEEFWKSPTGTALQDGKDGEPSEQAQIAIRLEARISELHRALQALETNKSKPDAPSVERSLPIENAVRMARLGASIDDLTKNCGLNIGEARLMQKLHGQAAAPTGRTH
ncbi:MAG TPA: DUF2802 domain-containing protein [Woeseiaceae bacterium]|nr:DUF2802 domain-containing protein [Woeseiaceae bacterium]